MFCLVLHLMTPSCLMSEHSEMVITLWKTLECVKHCCNTHTHLVPIGTPPLLSPRQQNNFPSWRDKVCILWHVHTSIWLNTRINMRCRNEILTSRFVDNAFIQREVKVVWVVGIHMGVNTVEQEKELLFPPMDTNAQGDRSTGTVLVFASLCSLMRPQHECRCAAWQLFMLVDTSVDKMTVLPQSWRTNPISNLWQYTMYHAISW